MILHRTVEEGGVDSMATLKTIDVPARGAVSFAPGGFHLMCMSPSKGMTPGHSVAVTLRFMTGVSRFAAPEIRSHRFLARSAATGGR